MPPQLHLASSTSPPSASSKVSHLFDTSPRKQPARVIPIQPVAKRSAVAEAQAAPMELGEYIIRDVALLKRWGWTGFIRQQCCKGNMATLDDVHHPAKCLLKLYKHRGAHVKFAKKPWSCQRINQAIKRGPHKSALEYLEFLKEEFVDMIENKGQWIVLPASEARKLPGLQVSPPGVVPQ